MLDFYNHLGLGKRDKKEKYKLKNSLPIVKFIYLKSNILYGVHMKTYSATVSSKGQITLPKKYREGYHLLEGEEVLILPTDDGILIKHKKTPLRGMLAGKIDSKEFEKELKTLRKEWVL